MNTEAEAITRRKHLSAEDVTVRILVQCIERWGTETLSRASEYVCRYCGDLTYPGRPCHCMNDE